MTKTAFDGGKTAHGGGREATVIGRRPTKLTCGCVTRKIPALSNPEKWWCCGKWRRRA